MDQRCQLGCSERVAAQFEEVRIKPEVFDIQAHGEMCASPIGIICVFSVSVLAMRGSCGPSCDTLFGTVRIVGKFGEATPISFSGRRQRKRLDLSDDRRDEPTRQRQSHPASKVNEVDVGTGRGDEPAGELVLAEVVLENASHRLGNIAVGLECRFDFAKLDAHAVELDL